MKKISLFLFAAFAVIAFSACNDSDGDYPSNKKIMTSYTLEGGDYYFLRDNGEKLYAGDKSRVTGYTAKDRQRVIIWFNLLSKKAEGYNYNIALYAVGEIYTGESKTVSSQEELDALGDAATSIVPDYGSLSSEWLTLYVGYPVADNSKHDFTLVINKVEAPEQTEEGYLDVELRHNPGGDTPGYTKWHYISFDLASISSELEGKKGISMRIKTQENGIKYLKYDLPQDK